MIDLLDLNAKAAIAFGLAMIVALLTYIAFFKDVEKHHPRSSEKK